MHVFDGALRFAAGGGATGGPPVRHDPATDDLLVFDVDLSDDPREAREGVAVPGVVNGLPVVIAGQDAD